MVIKKVSKLVKLWMLLLVAACWVSLASVASADGSSFVLSPVKAVEEGRGYYKDTVQPGEEREYTFYLRNTKEVPVQLKLYPADALPAQNGGRSFSEKEQKLRLVGKWLSPQGVQQITLKAKEKKNFTFKVAIPEDIQPGQYVSVIAAEELIKAENSETNASGQQASVAIDVVNRAGVQMVMEYLPDQAKHSMTIDHFNHDYIASGNSRLTVLLSNTGTILEKPKGKIILRDSKRQVMFQQDYQAESIYAGTTADMVYLVNDKLLLPDTYEVYYEATFSGQTISRTFSFTVTPEQSQSSQYALTEAGKIEITQTFWDWLQLHIWVLILIIVVIILFIGVLFWLLLLLFKKKKEEKKQSEEASAAHNDQTH
ncbi:COG1470 family protein [Paenibacillus albidus]|nr:DUF916 domain-containing protein [Paenibacillus albidus]